MQILKYINASAIFPDYAPTVKNWKNKMAGKSGRGKPLSFSESDTAAIEAGLAQLLTQKTRHSRTGLSKPTP